MKNIITILVMLMGVLTTNAQVNIEDLDTANIITDGWEYVGGETINYDDTLNASWKFNTMIDTLDIAIEKKFKFDNIDKLEIDINFNFITDSDNEIKYSIYIDGISKGSVTYNNDNGITNTLDIDDLVMDDDSVSIRVEFKYQGGGVLGFGYLNINHFKIIGYSYASVETVNLNELEVYSFGKSVFINSNDYIDNADVSVYDINGRLVNSTIMQINGKQELDLSDLNSGVYIVNVTVGTSVTQKKVFIN